MELAGQTTLGPVTAAERIPAMDVLRGFALLGILLMNIEAFVGPVNTALSGLDPSLTGADRLADALIYIFVQGKFYTMFSLLFGMGFAVMMQRAARAGRGFAALYLRRTLVLLAIGVVHMLLVWSGDILTAYALFALLLLALFRNTAPSRLPGWGVALYLFPPALMLLAGVVASLAQMDPAAGEGFAKAMADQGRQWEATILAQRQAYGSGSYLQAVGQRVDDAAQMLGYMLLTGWGILGMFLIGGWFVHSGAIERPQAFARLYWWLRWAGLPLGLATMLLSFWLMPTHEMTRMDATSGIAGALAAVASLLMCLGYVAWFVRGVQAGVPLMACLAPAGRMALTNYLAQSVVCTLLFYGYGLGWFEQLARAWQVPFVLALFALQVAFSHWWLARFRFGPAEWVWRAATYGVRPPMRLAVGAP